MIIEPLAIFTLILAFWHLPDIRADWHGVLIAAPLIISARWLLFRQTPALRVLIFLAAMFLTLSIFNFSAAPLSRAGYLEVAARPLLGLWIVIYAADSTRIFRRLDHLLLPLVSMAFITAVLALTASQWSGKADAFSFIIDRLPIVDYDYIIPEMLLSFNVNEIAGAMAWLCPLAAGMMAWRRDEQPTSVVIRWLSRIAFVLLAAALMLGQSRSAIFGVTAALMLLSWLLIEHIGWRRLAIVLLIGVAVFEAALYINVSGGTGNTLPDVADESTSTAESTLSTTADETQLPPRLQIFGSGVQMIIDNPLTGVGMSMFRTAYTQPRYMTPSYARSGTTQPHAHNEWIQIGADLGVGGVLFFAVLYGVIALMLWRTWRRGSRNLQVIVAAAGAALLGHAIYGMADAVTLWDRFSFIFWCVIGLAAAVYVLGEDEQNSHVTAG